jgi:tRNA (guanine10-N2)-dimethyltransferase
MIYDGEKNKLTYTAWEFSSQSEEIKEYLKQRFKSEKLKTAYKGLTGFVDNQSGKKESRPSSKLIEEEYFIFEEEGKQYFGKITQRCDYQEIENRDMLKPVRRPSLDISPRLAKILINLSGVRPGEKIYDPFCGIGVILQEALIQGMGAVGSEIDSDAIKGAQENMKWFGFDKDKYFLINFDSTKVDIPEVSGIVTEPDLGDTRKKIPTKDKAQETLNKFDNLMISVINNVKDKVSGRIVFTSPDIRIGKKRLHCNIERICENTGYSPVIEGLAEFRENQIVGRMIYVLEKSI